MTRGEWQTFFCWWALARWLHFDLIVYGCIKENGLCFKVVPYESSSPGTYARMVFQASSGPEASISPSLAELARFLPTLRTHEWHKNNEMILLFENLLFLLDIMAQMLLTQRITTKSLFIVLQLFFVLTVNDKKSLGQWESHDLHFKLTWMVCWVLKALFLQTEVGAILMW